MAEASLTDRLKRCARCGETKPLGEFWKDPTRRHGVQTYCTPCTQAIKAEYALRKEKLCTHCGETKALAEFKKAKWKRNGSASFCLPCYREYNRVKEAERRAAKDRPLCACGCGENVKYPGSMFRHGHRRAVERPRAPQAGDTDGTSQPKKRESAAKRKHKRCTKCGEVKPVAEYDHVSTMAFGKPGKRCMNACKPCARAATQEKRRHYTPEQKRKMKSRTLVRNYGITLDEYDVMNAAQGGACLSCGRTDEPLMIDHCHDTNRVRGLLCSRCNTALGMVGNSERVTVGLLAYIRTRCS